MRLLLLLCSLFAISMAAVIQKRGTLDTVIADGAICHTCEDVVSNGELMVMTHSYNKDFLTSLIEEKCATLTFFAKECKKNLNANFDTIDQSIRQEAYPTETCQKIDLCGDL